ncbi:MAG: YopX family protein [Bacteroidales bacterium]|nr:YopX family protein [Bacteroidales bacterium]
MRPIKFRGKNINNGEWMYGDLHILCDAPHIHTEASKYPFAGKRAFVVPDTVGQFTGLYDKNGKEIYEGDILGWKSVVCEEDGVEVFFGKVTFTEGVFCIDEDWESSVERVLCESEEYCIARVIGNIHDNPDLLKGGIE